MQTNINREDKNIIERWEWFDGWGKSNSTKRLFRRLRRRRQNRLADKIIKEFINK